MSGIERIALLYVLALVTYLFVATYPSKADVRDACQNDYMTYCSHTEPFSNTCRACMRAIGRRGGLSAGCVSALRSAGEITNADKAAYKKR